LGEQDKIEEAKKAIKDLITVLIKEKVDINVPNEIRQWILDYKLQFNQIS
jgi:hypothetical protein